MTAKKKPAKKVLPKKKTVKKKAAKKVITRKVKSKKVKAKKPLPKLEEEVIDETSEEEKLLLVEEEKRSVWERNNAVISEVYLNYIKSYKKFPSYAEIARRVNLNERTVRRHFEKAATLGDQTQKIKELRDQSLITIGLKAINGTSVHWSRLFHELAGDVIGGRGASATVKTTTPQTPSGDGKVEQEVTLVIT